MIETFHVQTDKTEVALDYQAENIRIVTTADTLSSLALSASQTPYAGDRNTL